MDKISNPFVPGAGISPPELTGRDTFLEDAQVTIERAKQGRFGKSFIAVGLRGVGKTVLLRRILAIAEEKKCKRILIEVHEDKKLPELIIPALRKILLEELDLLGRTSNVLNKALRILKSFISSVSIKYNDLEFGLSIDSEIGTADSGDIEIDLPELFSAVGKVMQERNSALIIILDEIQYLSKKELSALIMSIHRTSQENLPIVLTGAGLPLLLGKMGESKSYAERLFNFPEIGALNKEDAITAINAPVIRAGVNFDEDALELIFKLTKGYPYFLQEWAYVCWNIATGNEITLVDVKNSISTVFSNLDTSFFRVRFDRLTRREKQYLRAMAELGGDSHKSSEIAKLLEVSSNTLGPCRANLILKGMIYSPSYGDTAFTVPLFDEYMKRTMPFSTWHEE